MITADATDNSNRPRTNFSTCVGEEVVVHVVEHEQLEALKLPLSKGQLEGRLVGVERQGIWVEPKEWLEKGTKKGSTVGHVFLKWDDVIGIIRPIDSELFEEKKEYRGLRPR